MADYLVKNVGLCNVRINHEKGSWLLIAYGDEVELPGEAVELEFTQELIKSGALVAKKKAVARKTKAESNQPETAE